MNIVALDNLGIDKEKVLNFAKPFINLGHTFTYYDTGFKNEEDRINACKNADIIIITNSKFDKKIINECKNLKMISVGFTGIDHIDLNACKEKNIKISNSSGYATESTAEMTIALMLACLRNIVPLHNITKNSENIPKLKHNTLNGKTIGIIGTGAIGLRVAQILKIFNCNLIAYSRSENQEAKKMGIIYKSLDNVLKESDILTIHTPLNNETKNLINSENISKMKKTAILINCARGGIVDSKSLAEALNNNKILGAGIDVFEMEPPLSKEHPLLNAKNIILTPHIGYISEESFENRVKIVFENIHNFLENNITNIKL